MKNKFIRTIAMLAAIQSAFILSSCNSGSNGSNPYNSNPGGSDPQISAQEPRTPLGYQSVIDAGSSGSRIYNYMKLDKGGVVTVVDLGCSDKTESKLDSLTPNQAKTQIQNLVESTLTCLKFTTQIQRESVTVNLLATAGMRGLPEPQQNAIYDQVRIGIDATKAKAGKVKTITGSEEGLYSWANINYLQGNFEPNSTQIQTNGVYEVGGASAQIAFQISDGLKYGSYENKTSFNHHEVKVNNKSYNVVSISHLGLGQNEVRASLMQENNNYNSCYPTGYNQAESKGATPPILAVKGKFDYQSCSNVLNESINNFLYVNTLNTIPGFYDVKFIGLSGVTNALKFWGLDKDFNKPKELEKAINQTCPLYSWVLAQGLTTKSISKFDNVACQNAVYINNMLYNHFKFAPDQIKGVETINGQTPTWTQGFVVVE